KNVRLTRNGAPPLPGAGVKKVERAQRRGTPTARKPRGSWTLIWSDCSKRSGSQYGCSKKKLALAGKRINTPLGAPGRENIPWTEARPRRWRGNCQGEGGNRPSIARINTAPGKDWRRF